MTLTELQRKSKKRSDSTRQPETHFFLNRCLGNRIVPAAFKVAGIEFTTFAEIGFPDDADDHEWFKICGAKDWIGLTKDRNLSRRTRQIDEIMNAGATVYALTSSGLSGVEQAAILVRAAAKIQRVIQTGTVKRPFIGKIRPSGDAVVYLTHASWKKGTE